MAAGHWVWRRRKTRFNDKTELARCRSHTAMTVHSCLDVDRNRNAQHPSRAHLSRSPHNIRPTCTTHTRGRDGAGREGRTARYRCMPALVVR